MLPHLNFDIHVAIMKKLPVKSLIQFRSVCKSWKSCIDSPQFIDGYEDCHDHHVAVIDEDETEIKYVSFVGDDVTFPRKMFPHLIFPGTQIFGSSRGLLLLVESEPKFAEIWEPTIVVIWNPAIRKSIVVVVPPYLDDRFPFVLGFGVCPDTNDPMLVKVAREIEASSIADQVMVFTLSSGEWTSLCSSNLPRTTIKVSWNQTVVGRFIYWVATDGEFKYRNLIISFDMSTKEFREIDLPKCMAELPEESLNISRLRESLVVVTGDVGDVWVMEDGGFKKLYTINVPDVSAIMVRGFTTSGEAIFEIEDNFRDVRSTSTLVVYDRCSEQIKDFGVPRIRFRIRPLPFSWSSSYTESLLLLDHDGGHYYGEESYLSRLLRRRWLQQLVH